MAKAARLPYNFRMDTASMSGDRSHWPAQRGTLAEMEASEMDLSQTTTPAQRLAMVWELTQRAWALRGEPIDASALKRVAVRIVRSSG
jgi:hypothetical protein